MRNDFNKPRISLIGFCVACFCILFFQNTAFSQSAKIEDDIKECFQNTDFEKLGSCFCENISLEIQQQSGFYNKQHAINLLKNFFSKQSSGTFSTTSSGRVNKSETFFIIGKYKGPTQSFRVYILYRLEAEKEKIHSLSIINL